MVKLIDWLTFQGHMTWIKDMQHLTDIVNAIGSRLIDMVDHNNIDGCCQHYWNGLMMSWSDTDRLNNVNDRITRMMVWPSTKSHDSTKVRLIGLIEW